jgi:hypothetical protein
VALVGPDLSDKIKAALTPWNGVQIDPFCQALGNGLVLATSGQLSFTTKDSGAVPGAGAGTGKGIKGLDSAKMSKVIFDTGQGFWSAFQRDGAGVEWKGFCDKLSKAITEYLKAEADLVSTHAPVFAGSGQVLKYFGLVPDGVSGIIVAQGPPGWAAARFPELALAVATGYVTEITGHTPSDFVAIAGSPAAPPASGSGAGAGKVL